MHPYVELAKQAVEALVREGRVIATPTNLPPECYARKAGAFVSIHKDGELRGCVGTYLPTKANIAEEIIASAISTCSKDDRFSPVSSDELPFLHYEVRLLSNPIAIRDFDHHDPKTHGVIVRTSDGRCGLLLPDLEGIDTASQQITIACQKGMINPQKDGAQLYSFSVEKY